jgi:hypothetical protein
MEGNIVKRKRRTPEGRTAEIDAQIEKLTVTPTNIESKKKDAIAVFDKKIKSVKEKVKSLEQKKGFYHQILPKNKKAENTVHFDSGPETWNEA